MLSTAVAAHSRPDVNLETSPFADVQRSLDRVAYFLLYAVPDSPRAEEAGAAVLKYGAFIQSVLDFLIIAFVIFMMIRTMNRWKKKEEDAKASAPAEPSAEVKLLTEIRDALARSA